MRGKIVQKAAGIFKGGATRTGVLRKVLQNGCFREGTKEQYRTGDSVTERVF